MSKHKKSNRGGAVLDMQSRAIVTKTALIAAASRLFAAEGYYATGTSALVLEAGVTRGALYHHFKDKQDLFEAVFRQAAEQINAQTSAAGRKNRGSLWDQVVEGFVTYLDVIAANSDLQRVLLIDGPTVLGWQRWRDLQREYVASTIVHALEALMDAEIIPRRDPVQLSYLLQAALEDAALSIAHADDKNETGRNAKDAFIFLFAGLKNPSHRE